MKQLPYYRAIEGLPEWAASINSLFGILPLKGYFTLDGKPTGAPFLINTAIESIKKRIEYLNKFDYHLPEKLVLEVACSGKARAKLKHLKIPVRFEIRLIF